MHRFTKLKQNKIRWIGLLFFCFGLIMLRPAMTPAATFAVRISPPNFEINAQPGEIVRNVITIQNKDIETGIYHIRTADWEFNENNGVVIHRPDQPLAPGSCRPWTRLERRRLELAPNRVKHYRFEVHVPEDVQDGACKFAIVVSPAPETVDSVKIGNLDMPILGSIAVIVYVTVGDARPDLVLKAVKKIDQDGEPLPLLSLHNRGNAHARPFGGVAVEDATGKKADLIVVPFPILPGETRDIRLTAKPELSGIEKMSELTFPISLEGRIEWDGGNIEINTVIE